jgi:hypothetical protein
MFKIIVNLVRALIALFGSKVPAAHTASVAVAPTATEPQVIRETVVVKETSAPIVETVVALGTDTVRTETRTAVRFHKGTNVSVWGRNQQFDGDYIGGYVITDNYTGAKAVILTDREMAAFEINLVNLDVDAVVLVGDEAYVGHHQQGQNMDDVVANLVFDRADSRGNFALWVINQLYYRGYTIRGTKSVHGLKNIRAGELRSR